MKTKTHLKFFHPPTTRQDNGTARNQEWVKAIASAFALYCDWLQFFVHSFVITAGVMWLLLPFSSSSRLWVNAPCHAINGLYFIIASANNYDDGDGDANAKIEEMLRLTFCLSSNHQYVTRNCGVSSRIFVPRPSLLPSWTHPAQNLEDKKIAETTWPNSVPLLCFSWNCVPELCFSTVKRSNQSIWRSLLSAGPSYFRLVHIPRYQR